MVSPIYLIAAALGFAFLFPLVEKLGRHIAAGLGILLMAAFTALSVSWYIPLQGGAAPIVVQTAGFVAPLSINLMVDYNSALLLIAVNLIGTLALVWQSYFVGQKWKGKQVVLFFVMMLGANGLILTRDLFNIFVFMEITSIALYGLLSTSKDIRSYEAGFKYMIAGGLASTFYLIGVAFLYKITGTLNLDDMLGTPAQSFVGITGLMAMVFYLTGIIIELKPAFANGWALDTYQAGDAGIGALLSAVITSAMLAVLIKVLPLIALAAPEFLTVLAFIGALGFIVSSLMALNQPNLRRMLGLSSIAQTGLIIMILSFIPEYSAYTRAFSPTLVVLLVINHALAKAGIFWISDLLNAEDAHSKVSYRRRRILLVFLGMAVMALVGMPPFPAFWIKWTAVQTFLGMQNWWMVGVILIGSLLEAAYLFRWFISLARSTSDSGEVLGEEVPGDFDKPAADAVVPEGTGSGSPWWGGIIPGISIGILFLFGIYIGLGSIHPLIFLPIAAMLVFGLFDLVRLPQKVQVALAMAGLGGFGYYLWSVGMLDLSNGVYLPQIFLLMFLGGTFVQLIAFFSRKGRGDGLMALIMGMSMALVSVVISPNALSLFFSWEMMTITSFLLILRGRKAAAGAFRYIMFSLLSAYTLMVALLIFQVHNNYGSGFGITAVTGAGLEAMAGVPLAAVLFAVAALVKLGNIGLHLWLPSGYAEAEDDVSSLLSSVLSKVGVYLLLFVGGTLTAQLIPAWGEGPLHGVPLNSIIGWIGAITALAGALMALFQEDIKYTLAYSSMSQIGYIVLAMATMTHLGYVTSLYLSVTHLLFKAMLWLAVLGVIQRTGTRLMYKMGGLIKTMPFSFLTVLFGIIAVSGVPPLSGFGGKWLIYTSLMEKGWYLQAAVAMFSSGVAFLYLYRLIHSMFLGQPKDELVHVKEAPVVQLIPQYIFMAGIMAISMFPNLLLKPLEAVASNFFSETISWNGYEVISTLGYWNGNAVMYVTMGVFLTPLLILLISNSFKKVQKVKQFNIVFAAERPYKPETTHYSYNFFAHYQKALGFLVTPWTTRFWLGLTGITRQVGDGLRRWNTGNAQTYGFQILLFLLVVFAATKGGM